MNELPGKITHIESVGNLCVLSIQVCLFEMKAIFLENPSQNHHLRVGSQIKLLFKETEVMVAQSGELKISLTNCLPCTLLEIQKGELMTRLYLKFENYTLSSLFLSAALDKLHLKINDKVYILIKSNEIMIAPQ